MKQLLIILLTLFSLQSFAQQKYVVKVQGTPGITKAQLDSTANLKLAITDTTNKWLPITYKDTIHVDKYLNFDSTTKTLKAVVSNDPIAAGDSGKLPTDWVVKQQVSKIIKDTIKAAKTITSDLTVKNFKQENVHTYIDPNIPTAINAATYLTIPTYDGSGQTVHPDVYYNPNGWMGHKWWMAITPYYQQRQRFENPSLLYSDDGKTWNTPPGVTNPISAEPSDTINSFQYDTEIIPPGGYDNKLRVMYGRRDVDTSSAFYTRTYDGATIGPEVKAFDDGTEGIVSPAVIEKNGVYILYYVDVYNGYVIKKRTSTNPEGPWSDPVVCALTNNTGYAAWHLNANLIGDQVYLLLTVSPAGSSGSGAKLFFAYGVNDSTFITGSTPVLDKKAGSWDNASIYRSSAILLDGGTKRLGLYYSASDTLYNWHTAYTEINLAPYLPSSGGTLKGNLDVNPGGYASLIVGRSFSLNSYSVGLNGGIGSNLYFDGTNWRYINNGTGSLFWGGNGTFQVYTSPSGAAGAIAGFNPQFTVFNSGGVGVGGSATDPGVNNFGVVGKITSSTPLTSDNSNTVATTAFINNKFVKGTATLSSGTATVSATAITSTSKIMVTVNTPSGTQGFLSVPASSIVAGTSFVINSSSTTDNSTVNWMIIN